MGRSRAMFLIFRDCTNPASSTAFGLAQFNFFFDEFCILLLQIMLKGDGEAELRAKKTLNCEKRKNYKFDIAAVSCSGEVSEK